MCFGNKFSELNRTERVLKVTALNVGVKLSIELDIEKIVSSLSLQFPSTGVTGITKSLTDTLGNC